MRISRFTESRILLKLKESEAGRKVAEVCREHSVSQGAYYKWTSSCGGMEVADIQGFKELEVENKRLKQMFADLSLENVAPKDVIAKRLLGQPSNAIWLTTCARSTP